MKRAIVVVYGKNSPGVIYHISKICFDNDIDILDIRQTIIDGYFNMMAVVDTVRVKDRDKVRKAFELLEKKLNIRICFHKEEAFIAMHKV